MTREKGLEIIQKMVESERKRQDGRWNTDFKPLCEWMTILMEEVGEMSRAILEDDGASLMEELCQVCAIAQNIGLQCFDGESNSNVSIDIV